MKLTQWTKVFALSTAVALAGCATNATQSASKPALTPTAQLLDVSKLPQGLERCPNDQTENLSNSPSICFVPSENAFTVYYDVKFAQNSEDMTSADKVVTDQLISIIKDYNVGAIELNGYTSTKHDETYAYLRFAKNLSEQRAEGVKTYMVQKGVKAQQITVVANGLDKPIAPNNSANRSYNQRVSASFTVSLTSTEKSSENEPAKQDSHPSATDAPKVTSA